MSFFGSRRQIEPAPATNHESAPEPKLNAPQHSVGFESVLGANSTLEGVLRSSANVRLDGTFTGTLEITGNVLVGETARINADINARNISIAGAVRGNVSGKKVQLLRTGRIWGDIRAAALTTEEGAFIDGKITMISQEAALPAVTAAEPELVPDDDNPTIKGQADLDESPGSEDVAALDEDAAPDDDLTNRDEPQAN